MQGKFIDFNNRYLNAMLGRDESERKDDMKKERKKTRITIFSWFGRRKSEENDKRNDFRQKFKPFIKVE